MKRLIFAVTLIFYTILVNDFDAETDTIFLLFTSKNAGKAQILESNAKCMKNSNFNPKNPVRIIIHGFRDGPHAVISTIGKDAYLTKGNFNIIVVDWSKGANNLNFLIAKRRIYEIGPIIAEFIEFLLETYPNDLKLSDINLIGHSIGAHLAGIVGKSMKIGKLPVIVGLDPTGWVFDVDNPDERLDKGDAEYVEVIHTNGAVQGIREPIGDADFYPNYGEKQPGCGIDINGACSHQRAAYLFVESINSEKHFYATFCESYGDILNENCTENRSSKIKMGGEFRDKEHKASGIYYLRTKSESPFVYNHQIWLL